MIPTAWSILFDGDRLPPEASRRLRQSASMESMHRALRGLGDLSSGQAAENAVESALRHALEIPLLEVLVSAWRRHPDFPAALQAAQHSEHIVLFGMGEHEVVSTHQPRVDVVGPTGTLVSFEVELRLELQVQSATLWMERDAHTSGVTIGACRGLGTLRLDGQELASCVREDIRFPDDGPARHRGRLLDDEIGEGALRSPGG